MIQTKADISSRIKQALDMAKVSQKAFADALDITEASVSAYTNGKSLPTAMGFAILSDLTNISLDWIITGKPNSQETTLAKLPADEAEKVRSVLNKRPGTHPVNTSIGGSWKNESTDRCREGPPEWEAVGPTEKFIFDEIKKGDPELIHDLVDVILKRRAKPEGCSNGMEGQLSTNS